ncbi:hypothetical protein Vretimale_16938 [Volvox reticuliferus]|uniref:Uncharacterized protein n=1 Tax=Volvox reticuliferus TaxID=1737510 RepID=A0A8J4LX97_9CHLO|nr:hypothetical protein Vretimale_16938 [Volvox reticuliferus]
MSDNRLFGHVAVACCLLATLLRPVLSEDHRDNSQLKFPSPKDWCIALKTPLDCDLREDCVWCEKPGKKFGKWCYSVSAAKLVPKAWGLVCDKDLDPSSDDPQLAGTCDGRSEASCVAPDCVWCTSAAVGGGCYTPDEAKLLPKAIFKCKTPPAAIRLTDTERVRPRRLASSA